MFAQATNQRMRYGATESKLNRFAQDVETFRSAVGRGMNATAPFKLEAFACATHHSVRSGLSCAGLTHDVILNLGRPLPGKRVLLLGAGGAPCGARMLYLDKKPAALVVANLTLHTALTLA